MDPMSLQALPVPVPASATAPAMQERPGATSAAVATPYWSAFDQEIIETVLFTSGVPADSATSTPPHEQQSFMASRPPHLYSALSQATVSPSGGIIGNRPLETSVDSPTVSIDSRDKSSSTDDASATSTVPKSGPKKRRRNYNEDTRAKHREVQRRFINRKKERVDQEKQYACVLEKQVQLLQAQTEAAALEREKSSLLQECVANGIDLDSQDMTTFLQEEMEMLSQYYTPLQPNETSAILQQTLRYVDGFCPDEAFLDDGTSLVGWKQQSRVEHKTISFRIGKDFPGSPAAQVFESTGYAMATMECFSNIFGAGVVIMTKLLQLVDMNTVILYRAIYHPVTKEISRSVELLCRVQRGDGFVILMQSLEGLNIQTFVGTLESWVRGVVWCEIKPLPGNDEGCSIQWTGCVGQCPVESLEQWQRDLVFLVLRYEGIIIAPLVTLPLQDEPQEQPEDKSTAKTLPAETTSSSTGSSLPRPLVLENDGDNEGDDDEKDATDASN